MLCCIPDKIYTNNNDAFQAFTANPIKSNCCCLNSINNFKEFGTKVLIKKREVINLSSIMKIYNYGLIVDVILEGVTTVVTVEKVV